MTKCDVCGGELKNGMPMYMGKRHWERHEKEYGEKAGMSFQELMVKANEEIKEIVSILDEKIGGKK